MAVHFGGFDITLEAAAAITQYHLVMTNGTSGEVTHTTANTSLGFGVAQEAAAADGDKVRIRVGGVTKVKCGGTCTYGAKLMADSTAGRVIAHSGETNPYCGVALADGDDGDIIPMVIHVGEGS